MYFLWHSSRIFQALFNEGRFAPQTSARLVFLHVHPSYRSYTVYGVYYTVLSQFSSSSLELEISQIFLNSMHPSNNAIK